MNTLQRLSTLLLLSSIATCPCLAWIGGNNITASNQRGHGRITIEACRAYDDFAHWISGEGTSRLDTTKILLETVSLADAEDEKYWVATIPERHPGYKIIQSKVKKGADAKVPHCVATVHTELNKDPRLWNGRECVRLAITMKESDPRQAVRLFANGIHLLQDYCAHFNAPGAGSTGVSHGVTTLIDAGGDGKKNDKAGNYVDLLEWDIHSEPTNNLPGEGQKTDLFNADYWHRHSDFKDCWRYQAARALSIQAMRSFLTGDIGLLDKAYELGYIEVAGNKIRIDLLKNFGLSK